MTPRAPDFEAKVTELFAEWARKGGMNRDDLAAALAAQHDAALERAAEEYGAEDLADVKVYCRHVAQRLRELKAGEAGGAAAPCNPRTARSPATATGSELRQSSPSEPPPLTDNWTNVTDSGTLSTEVDNGGDNGKTSQAGSGKIERAYQADGDAARGGGREDGSRLGVPVRGVQDSADSALRRDGQRAETVAAPPAAETGKAPQCPTIHDHEWHPALPAGSMRCAKCGAEIVMRWPAPERRASAEERVCPKCGSKSVSPTYIAASETPKEHLVCRCNTCRFMWDQPVLPAPAPDAALRARADGCWHGEKGHPCALPDLERAKARVEAAEKERDALRGLLRDLNFALERNAALASPAPQAADPRDARIAELEKALRESRRHIVAGRRFAGLPEDGPEVRSIDAALRSPEEGKNV